MKKYKITFESFIYDWNCVVEIDEEKSKAPIKEMVEFWMGWEHRLAMNDNDYIKTFLQQLARKIFYLSFAEGYNLNGIITCFNNWIEGWYKMNGEYGIKILEVDPVEIEADDFSVQLM